MAKINIPECQRTAEEILAHPEFHNRGQRSYGALAAIFLGHCERHGSLSVLAVFLFLPERVLQAFSPLFKGISTWPETEIEKMRSSHGSLSGFSTERLRELSRSIVEYVESPERLENELYEVLEWLDQHRS